MNDAQDIYKLYKGVSRQSKPHKDRYGHIWWKLSDGRIHREDGPAVEYNNGGKAWYLFNKPHRTDGYAIIDLMYNDKSFYVMGTRYDDVMSWAKAAVQYEHHDAEYKPTQDEIDDKVAHVMQMDFFD